MNSSRDAASGQLTNANGKTTAAAEGPRASVKAVTSSMKRGNVCPYESRMNV